MKAPYRNETDALRERQETLQGEAADLERQTTELEVMRARKREVERELADIAARLGGRRVLPMLDQVRVAAPCSASWDAMVGDARERFCGGCAKNVYNLSAMSRDEAEQFLADRVGNEVCIRYYQRADGTVMTDDCPVGVTRRRRKRVALAVAGAGAMAFAAVSMTRAQCHATGSTMVQGEMQVVGKQAGIATSPTVPLPTKAEPSATPTAPPHAVRMGGVRPRR